MAAADGGQEAAQGEPMLLGNLAQGDGDEAREPGLGSQQVVIAAIQAMVDEALLSRRSVLFG